MAPATSGQTERQGHPSCLRSAASVVCVTQRFKLQKCRARMRPLRGLPNRPCHSSALRSCQLHAKYFSWCFWQNALLFACTCSRSTLISCHRPCRASYQEQITASLIKAMVAATFLLSIQMIPQRPASVMMEPTPALSLMMNSLRPRSISTSAATLKGTLRTINT